MMMSAPVPDGIDEVWRSLAEPEWLGEDASIDMREAGEVRAGERTGFVEEADAPRRLVFWWSDPGEEATRVEIDLDESDTGVTVTFRHGPPRTFDVVVVAEGLTSRTRSLVFPEATVHELGLCLAYLTIPRTATDNDWWRWYHASGGRSVTLRPDNVGTIRATLSFLSDVRGLEDLDPSDQAQVLRRTTPTRSSSPAWG